MMKTLTVKEAVERVKRGETLEGISLDKNSLQQVNVRDAMVLSEGGIVIPEQNIYYDDTDIEYDEDIDELTITSGPVQLSWEEKAKRAVNPSKADLKEEAIAYNEAFEGDWVPVKTDGLAEAEAGLTTLLPTIFRGGSPRVLDQSAAHPSEPLRPLDAIFHAAYAVISRRFATFVG